MVFEIEVFGLSLYCVTVTWGLGHGMYIALFLFFAALFVGDIDDDDMDDDPPMLS